MAASTVVDRITLLSPHVLHVMMVVKCMFARLCCFRYPRNNLTLNSTRAELSSGKNREFPKSTWYWKTSSGGSREPNRPFGWRSRLPRNLRAQPEAVQLAYLCRCALKTLPSFIYVEFFLHHFNILLHILKGLRPQTPYLAPALHRLPQIPWQHVSTVVGDSEPDASCVNVTKSFVRLFLYVFAVE